MAQIYHPKKTSAKLAEGFVAGVIGGIVILLLLVIADVLTANRSWWYSTSLFGGLFTGVRDFNTASPDVTSLVLGVVVLLALFGLLGMGLIFYTPLFRRFNLDPILGGAIYGLFIWFTVLFLFMNAFWPGFVSNMNNIALAIATVIGGAAMGFWLKRSSSTTT